MNLRRSALVLELPEGAAAAAAGVVPFDEAGGVGARDADCGAGLLGAVFAAELVFAGRESPLAFAGRVGSGCEEVDCGAGDDDELGLMMLGFVKTMPYTPTTAPMIPIVTGRITSIVTFLSGCEEKRDERRDKRASERPIDTRVGGGGTMKAKEIV